MRGDSKLVKSLVSLSDCEAKYGREIQKLCSTVRKFFSRGIIFWQTLNGLVFGRRLMLAITIQKNKLCYKLETGMHELVTPSLNVSTNQKFL